MADLAIGIIHHESYKSKKAAHSEEITLKIVALEEGFLQPLRGQSRRCPFGHEGCNSWVERPQG